MTKPDEKALEDFFAEARSVEFSPSEDLLERVVADANDVHVGQLVIRPSNVGSSIWPQFMDFIGGWPSLGGVAAAGITGLWLGLVPTASLDGFAAGLLGETTSISFMQEYDIFGEDTFDG